MICLYIKKVVIWLATPKTVVGCLAGAVKLVVNGFLGVFWGLYLAHCKQTSRAGGNHPVMNRGA